jgi:hypothetical protein
LRISRNITKDDFGERYQEVEGMRWPVTISGDVIGEVRMRWKCLHGWVKKKRR